ncbi:MAG: hypothetical protein SFZ03_01360 [Candidatus Melainabacteria bacterium]|nr:hypothetical protein [Candidatus Melainabacteria bacterium]
MMQRRSGQGITEYAFLMGILAVLAVAGLTILGEDLSAALLNGVGWGNGGNGSGSSGQGNGTQAFLLPGGSGTGNNGFSYTAPGSLAGKSNFGPNSLKGLPKGNSLPNLETAASMGGTQVWASVFSTVHPSGNGNKNSNSNGSGGLSAFSHGLLGGLMAGLTKGKGGKGFGGGGFNISYNNSTGNILIIETTPTGQTIEKLVTPQGKVLTKVNTQLASANIGTVLNVQQNGNGSTTIGVQSTGNGSSSGAADELWVVVEDLNNDNTLVTINNAQTGVGTTVLINDTSSTTGTQSGTVTIDTTQTQGNDVQITVNGASSGTATTGTSSGSSGSTGNSGAGGSNVITIQNVTTGGSGGSATLYSNGSISTQTGVQAGVTASRLLD